MHQIHDGGHGSSFSGGGGSGLSHSGVRGHFGGLLDIILGELLLLVLLRGGFVVFFLLVGGGVVAFISFFLGNVISVCHGFSLNVLNFLGCFLISDLLGKLCFDEVRSEFDGGFSGFSSLLDGLGSGDVVTDGFLSDLLSDLSADNSQLFEFTAVLVGVLLGILGNGNDDVTSGRCLDHVLDGLSSLVIDVVGNLLKCLLDGFLCDLESFVSDLLLFVVVELVGGGGLLGKFLGNLGDLLVNLSLDFLNNLLDLLLMVLDLGGDVLGDDTVGDDVLLVGNLHAALRHEDSLFGSEGLGKGGVTLGFHSLEFSFGEVTLGLS